LVSSHERLLTTRTVETTVGKVTEVSEHYPGAETAYVME